ncbi:CHRD domain-containing protein [Sandarakinorhabdus sp.]|uniref:CHRD domain-containing protein n=1 Tax=Sandarakinorhabdus sp. TaxID=1916663 RepID=UPI00286E71E9|nr:CHRD domain-containing protein [Sandarakinorhabdus sp.]
MIKAMLFGAAALMIAASPATATTFRGTFSGANEVPVRASAGTGIGDFRISDDNRFATVQINFTGVTGPLRAAHIHCCALPTANGPVAIDFAPPAISSGSISRLFDLTLGSTYTSGFLTAGGGTAAGAQARLLAGLNAGQGYFNLHTAAFPGGEIRANLSAIPEPSSWAMLLAGFGLVGGTLRRRRLVAA